MTGTCVLFSQKQKIVVPFEMTDSNPQLKPMVLAFNRQLESYGYCLSEPLMDRLLRLTMSDLTTFAIGILEMIENELGIRPQQEPFYPNFPNEVMALSEVELYLNALKHYWTEGTWKPDSSQQLTYPLIHESQLKILELGQIEDYDQLFIDKCQSPVGVNAEDRHYFKWYIDHYPTKALTNLPDSISHRETATTLAALLIDVPNSDLTPLIKNATEVLRLATYLSGGDILLTKPSRIKSFKRSERRRFMALLNQIPHNISEELWARREFWLRFSEKVHPLEYTKTYPKVAKAFQVLHAGKKPKTFNSKMEALFESEDYLGLAALLVKRPTVFARQLDRFLRLEERLTTQANYPSFVLFNFKTIVHELSTPVLIKLWTHFHQRHEVKPFRAFFPKGSLTKCYGILDEVKPLPAHIVKETCQLLEEAICQQFAQKEPLGKVYLDERLKQYAIPYTQRTTSKSLQTIARYSRLDVSEYKHLRPFVYWQDAEDKRCDLDLSLMVFSENLEELVTVTFYDLVAPGLTHSGDFVSGKDGAAEYVDVNLDVVESIGGRYGVILINSFSLTPFNELPDCFVGFMGRDGVSGKAFEPKTVLQKFDLSNDSMGCVPAIIDFQTREVIWVDLSIRTSRYLNTAHNSEKAAYYLLRSMIETSVPMLYDLFQWHIQARQGEWVETEEAADVVFGGETGIQPWDYNEILANWLV